MHCIAGRHMLSLCVCYNLYGPEPFIKSVFVRLFSVRQTASDFRHFCDFPIPPKVSVSSSESFFKKVSFFSVQREKIVRNRRKRHFFRFGRKKISEIFLFNGEMTAGDLPEINFISNHC